MKRPAGDAGRFEGGGMMQCCGYVLIMVWRDLPLCDIDHTCPIMRLVASASYGEGYAPTTAEPAPLEDPATVAAATGARSEIAAVTRSAIRSAVKPTCSCSSAGLPCVT
jgi:hypothetical protein